MPVFPRRTWPSLALLVLIACSESPTSPPPPPPVCSYTVAPASASMPAAGGSATFQVSTGTACAWTSTPAAAWLTVTSGQTGTGPGPVVVAASANPATATRSGTVTIAGVTVTVNQEGQTPCMYAIDPTGATFEADGGTATVAVTTTSGCAWQATAGAAWLTVLSGATGTGPGTVTYKVDRHIGVHERSGTLTIAGLTFTVRQYGDVSTCTYSVSPVTLSICMAWSYDLVTAVSTQDGCPWTAASTAGWMTVVEGATGTGTGLVRLRGESNYDARRSGIVEVRWPTVTAGQNVVVDQAGCTYVATPSTFNFTAAAGTGRFDLYQQSDPMECGGPLQNACVWSAVSNVSWITVTSSMPRTGDDPVNFTVAENTSTSPRTGTITVRNRVVTVTQNGR